VAAVAAAAAAVASGAAAGRLAPTWLPWALAVTRRMAADRAMAAMATEGLYLSAFVASCGFRCVVQCLF
jgi:hypothetical protein